MQRDAVIAALRAHEAELRDAGVATLSVFGSVARGESSEDSDVDILVRLEDQIPHSGFRYFGCLTELESRLRDILGTDIDLVLEPVRKERLRRSIAQDRIIAF